MKEEADISQELLEIIERYQKNEMSTTERASFELRLEENSVLRQQVDDTAILFSGIKKAVLKDKLEAIHVDLIDKNVPEKEPEKVFRINFRKWSIAASILILMGGFWFFNQPSKSERLFNKYYEKPLGLPTVMGGDTKQFEFLDAMVEFKIGDYDSAIERWEALQSENQTNDTLQFYLGVAYLAKGNQKMAIPHLKKLIQNKQSHFQNRGGYYLGLAYIKDEKWNLAKEMLKETTTIETNELLKELE